MKEIVIFYPHISEYGGIERLIVALAIEANSRGIRPVLLCFYDRLGMKRFEPNLEVVELGQSRNPWTKARKIRKWLEGRPSVAGLPLFFGAKAGFYGAIGRPMGYALHYTDPPSLVADKVRSAAMSLLWIPRKLIANRITRLGVKKATVRMTMTRWTARELESIYSCDFDVVHLGGMVPAEPYDNRVRCQGDTLRLFSICRLQSSKNLDWILDAAAALKRDEDPDLKFPSIEVVIAGKGPESDNLRRQSESMGLQDIVKFPGFMSDAQVEEGYRTADLFLVPARQGFGLPVLEALFRRLPVLLNRESRISETLESNPWAAISDDNSQSFSATMLKHIKQLRTNYPAESHVADLPTEQAWAQDTGKRCRWW
jgi:glycosyltransferase involved in cell wall biosynthesis